MSQQNGLVDMKSLVRNAVLAQQMNRKRAAVAALDGQAERKIQKVNDQRVETGSRLPVAITAAASKRGGKRRQKEEFNYPVEPRIICIIKQPRTIVNHSYRDFSQVPLELTDEKEKKIDDMTLSEKVHDILSIPDYKPFISWMSHGRAFRVQIPKIFEEKICPKYFGHSRYSSFLRLLNNHGFKHITQGADRNCYYHECFLRNMPHLCKYMPKPKNARHLTPDPDNEPDFYKLSRLYPLTDQEAFGEIEIPSASLKKLAPAMPRDPPMTKVAAKPKPVEKPAKKAPPTTSAPQPTPTLAAASAASPQVASHPMLQQQRIAYQHQMPVIGGYTASALMRRQRLLEQAAALEGQAAAIDNNALLNAALRGSLNGQGNFLGGRFRF